MASSSSPSSTIPDEVEQFIDIGSDKKVRAVVLPVENCKTKTGVILTHGAGGDLDEEQITLLSLELAKQGLVSMRFTYKAPILDKRVEVYKKVVKWLLEQKYGVERVIVGGRSMGARAVLELTSDESLKEQVCGGLCLSYPLHKDASSKSDLRNSAFSTVLSPLFFASGTKDPMCQQEVMKNAIKTIPSKVELLWIDGANHSGMPKRKRQEEFEVPDYFHSVVAWVCEQAEQPFKPELATNNDPGAVPVASMMAKRRRDIGDDSRAKREYDTAAAVLCRK